MNTQQETLLTSLEALAALPLEEATAMPPAVYTSTELLTLEEKNIFQQQWLCAGRADIIPTTGDYTTWQIGSQPIVLIRQKDQSVKAFANICRHRMMQLLDGQGQCKQQRIVCPYHAWTYAADGQCIAAPRMESNKHFQKEKFSLAPIRCEVWRGWLYVTLNSHIPSVAEQLKELDEVVNDYHMENYVHVVQEDHVWNTNWKLLTENFMEGYHLPVAHRATVGAHFGASDTVFGPVPDNHAFTWQSFTKADGAPFGLAHENNTSLSGEQRRTSIMPTVFPTHMYVLAPDHLWYLSLQPEGCDYVRIRYGAALAPEAIDASDDTEALRGRVVDFLAEVNEEDKFVVEGIARGARATLSTPGPLCWMEKANHDFTRYLVRQLRGASD